MGKLALEPLYLDGVEHVPISVYGGGDTSVTKQSSHILFTKVNTGSSYGGVWTTNKIETQPYQMLIAEFDCSTDNINYKCKLGFQNSAPTYQTVPNRASVLSGPNEESTGRNWIGSTFIPLANHLPTAYAGLQLEAANTSGTLKLYGLWLAEVTR